MGDVKKLGRIGIKLIVIFLGTTFIAAAVGLISALVINPGSGFIMTEISEVTEQAAPTVSGTILGFFGTNIIGSMADGTMLHVITFAILSGIGIMFMKEDDQKKILNGFGLISRYIMSFLRLVMKFTPIGVFCLMANTCGLYGTDVLGPLGKFILTIYVGLAIHAFVVYGTLYAVGTRKSPLSFWKLIAPVWTTSFSTCSTAATMPVSMRTCEENLKLRKEVSDLTIPLGANMNMDGNGLWYGVVAVFVAEVVGISVPFLHIIDEAVKETERRAPGIKKAGVLATTAAMQAHVYEKSCDKFGIEVMSLPGELQELMQAAIFDHDFGFKYNGRTEKCVEAAKTVARYLIDNGAEALIMGCTEIPIILEGSSFAVPLIDPNETIAEAAVRYVKQG